MDLPSLHKKLLPNWSAGTVSKLLSSTSNLDVVKNGFNKLEKKTQMRVLLSLLNFDSRSRSDQLGSIQSLLEYASEDKNGKWLPVIAGLVHARIIGNKEISDSDVESTAFYQLEETADKIIKQLIDEDQKNLTQNSLNFQPLELKYLTLSNNGDISKQSKDTNDLNVKTEHFMYFGGKPDLITLASKGLEEKHLNDMKNKNVPAIGRNREVYGVKNSSSSGSSSSSSSSSSMSKSSSTVSSLGMKKSTINLNGRSLLSTGGSSRRQPANIIPIEQLNKDIQKNKDLDQIMKDKEAKTLLDKSNNEIRRHLLDKSNFLDKSLISNKRKIAEVEGEKETPPHDNLDARVAKISKTEINSKTDRSDELFKATDIGTYDPHISELGVTIVSGVSSLTTESPSNEIPVMVTAPVISDPPVISAPVISDPPISGNAVNPDTLISKTIPSTAPIVSGGMDLQVLFATSPLLTLKDKEIIERFFSENWSEYFTESVIKKNSTIKIKLQTDEKINADGGKTIETISLQLDFNPYSWKKLSKKKKVPAP